jgi:hypothetical protein
MEPIRMRAGGLAAVWSVRPTSLRLGFSALASFFRARGPVYNRCMYQSVVRDFAAHIRKAFAGDIPRVATLT